MKSKRRPAILLCFACLLLLFFAFLSIGGLRTRESIVLPPETSESGDETEETASLRLIAVTPETVQNVVATLARPENYTQTVTVERMAGEGVSGASVTTLDAANGWVRLSTDENGTKRCVLTNGEKTYIWYPNSTRVFTGSAVFSADEEYGVPTYEDLLSLKPNEIAAADYCSINGDGCVFAETVPDADGYFSRYWIRVSDGLLTASEQYCGDALLVRTAALTTEYNTAKAESFLLPDGTAP